MADHDSRINEAPPGSLIWHSSEEDSGPDVGVSIKFSDTAFLHCGEITNRLHCEAGYEGEAGGWWLILYDGDSSRVIGKADDPDAAKDAFDKLAALCAARPPTPAPQEGLVERIEARLARMREEHERFGAKFEFEKRLCPIEVADVLALLAALTPSPVQSSPGEVERLREAYLYCSQVAGDRYVRDLEEHFRKCADNLPTPLIAAACERTEEAGRELYRAGYLNGLSQSMVDEDGPPNEETVIRAADEVSMNEGWDGQRDHFLAALTPPSSPASAEVGEIVERLRPALAILPIETRDTPDYAEATGPGFQAMTMNPAAFLALNELPKLFTALATIRAEQGDAR